MVCSISATIVGWMPSVGSSRMSSFGSVMRARAIASCWRCPPESRPAFRAANCLQCGEASHLRVDEGLAAPAPVGDELQILERGELAERLLTLRHVRHAASDALVGGERRDVFAVEQHAALRRLDEPDRDTQQRRLAGAVVAEHGHDLPGRHRHAVQHPRAPVAGLDVGELEHVSPPSASASRLPRPASLRADGCHFGHDRHGGRGRGSRGAEVDLLHLGVGLHLGHRAVREHLALVQHRHARGEAAHEVHVVLDHQHNALRRDALQELAGRGALVLAHAGDGFVEQQHPRVLHEQHRDLQPLLLAVRQDAGRRGELAGESCLLERLHDRRVDATPGPQQRGRGAVASGGDVEVLQHRELVEDARGLERAADPESDDLVHRPAEQLLLAEPRRPGGLGEPRDGVDAGRLAGAVRADEEPDLAEVRVEGDAVDRDEARELDVEVRDDERGVGHDFTSSSSGAAVAAAGCSPGLRRAAVNLASTDDSPFGRKRMTTMNSRPMM